MIRLLIALTCLSAILMAGMYIIKGIRITVVIGSERNTAEKGQAHESH